LDVYDDGDNMIVLSLSTGKGGAGRVERACEKSERVNIYLLKRNIIIEEPTTDVKIHIIHIRHKSGSFIRTANQFII